jgi:hypothetical protein
MVHLYKRQAQSGFALVIALSLMAFILLLLLSISTLVQVETTSASISKHTLEARQNALLGAYIAVGNLQKYAGSDQRVTATADILNDADPTKAKLTGVWDADPASPTYEEPLDWLVSRDPAATFNAATYQQTATSSTDDIELVSARRVGDLDEVEAVRATPVNITGSDGSVSGQFAYWVGDEGVKARINLTNQQASTPTAVAKVLAERAAPEGTFNNGDLQTRYSTAVENQPEIFSKIEDYDSLSFLGTNAAESEVFAQEFREGRHDFTTYSVGLFTDTKNGGLKRDLTTLFEADDSVFQNVLVTDTLATPPGASASDPLLITDYNPDGIRVAHLFAHQPSFLSGSQRIPGPTWNLLRDYYRQYSRLNASGDTIEPQRALPVTQDGHVEIGIRAMHDQTNAGTGAWHLEQAFRNEPGWGLSSGDYPIPRPTSMKIHPIITEMQYLFSYRLVANPGEDGDPATPDDYELQLVVDPVITLWNPYNVDLDLSKHAFTSFARGLPVLLQMTVDPDGPGGPEPAVVHQIYTTRILGGSTPSKSYVISLTGVTLNAGEIITFSPNNSSPSPQTANLSLSPGWNQDGGFYAEEIASQANGSNRKRVTGNLDATVSVDFQHDAVSWANTFFTRVFLVDTTSGNQFDAIGDKPHSFELSEIRVEPQGYTKLANAMDPINFSFGLVDPLGGGTSLNSAKEPFGLIRYHLKAEDEFEGSLAQYSPMAYITNARAAGINNNSDREDFPIAPNWGLEVESANGYNAVNDPGYFGSARDASGEKELVLYDIPRAPLHSIAQLGHADSAIFATEPMYLIGNSFASPYVSLAETAANFGPNLPKIGDMSYFANEAIWDRYFFSTAADNDPSTAQGGAGTPHRNAFLDFLDNPSQSPLLNPRIWPLPSEDVNSVIADEVFGATDGFTKMANYVGMLGAFNINSTSVDAWRAVLSGNRAKSNANESDFSRFSDEDSDVENSGNWTGYLALSDSEIDSLAQEIVDRVKTEGPFLSLAQFINRDPSGTTDLQKTGLLQRAIEATNINSGFSQAAIGISVGSAIAANSADKVAAGAATYLLQGDILSAIGSSLSPRSDTFVIRSYGSVQGGFSSTEQANEYLEMVVQRTTEEITSGSNDRRFKVIRTQWINPSQI